MALFLAVLSDVVGILAGAIAIWLGIRVLKDDAADGDKNAPSDQREEDSVDPDSVGDRDNPEER